MTLFWHLIAADLRRHRLLLIAWLVVIAAAATLEAVTPMLAADAAVGESTRLLGGLLWLTELLLTALIVPLVIQAHPLVGSNAFWMTRPIRPDMLLAAKAALLATVIVVAPVITRIAVMIIYYVPARHILGVSADTALFRIFWLTALAVLAAVTPTVARFVLVCGGVLGVLAIAIATALAVAMARMGDDRPTIGAMQAPDPTGGVVLLVLVIASGVALLFVQYRTRSRIRAVALGAAALAVAILAASAWPWPLLAPRLEVPLWAAAPARPLLVVSTASVKAADQTDGMSRRAKWRSVRARVYIDGLEPGWLSQVVLLDATLKIPGRGDLVSAAYGTATVPAKDSEQNPVHEVVSVVLGVQRLVDSNPPLGESPPVLTVRDSDFRRLQPAFGAYRGRFQIVPTRYEIETRLPLRVNAAYQQGAYRIVIENVEYASGAIAVEVRESNARTNFERVLPPQRKHYLRNQSMSEAIEGVADSPHFTAGFLPGFGFSSESGSGLGFRAQRHFVEFPPRYSVQRPSFAIDDSWLEGAELVVVRATQARPFERTLEIPDFPLRLEPPKPTGQDGSEAVQP